jgi:hypothetical protein
LQRCTKTCGALQTLREAMSDDANDVAGVPQVVVNRPEYDKFCYLIKVMDALDRADLQAQKDIEFFKSTEGVRAERKFDWNLVTRHISPQLLVSFLRGAERWEDERMFREYPHSVIVVRTAQVVKLDEVFELTLEVVSTDNGTVDSAQLFSQLRDLAKSKKGLTSMDVGPIIRRLERALNPE